MCYAVLSHVGQVGDNLAKAATVRKIASRVLLLGVVQQHRRPSRKICF